MQDQTNRPTDGREDDRISIVLPAGVGETFDQRLADLQDNLADFGRERIRHDAANTLRHQLDWDNRHPGDAIELTAPRWLLFSVVAGALVVAADRLTTACHEQSGAAPDFGLLKERHEHLGVLIALLSHISSVRSQA